DYEADLAHLGARAGIDFATKDVAAWCREAKQRGVRIMAEPAKQGGAVLARFADTDGNEFTVTQADGGEARAKTRKSG
ncbi:MAG: VOC family protein, partial [Halobacteriales archaeon]|nr:VOC family protein [Halobacteriales archaeon]